MWEIKPKKYSQLTHSYDVGVVLGGFSAYDLQYDRPLFHDDTDRLLIALQLYKKGYIKKILIVGGSGSLSYPTMREAPIVQDYLVSIGFPKKDILIESTSKNTRENAIYTVQFLNSWKPNATMLLITSYHMRRAFACFKKAGANPDHFSVDAKAGPRKFFFDHLFIPNVGVLNAWNLLLHEWMGFTVYRIAGYL